MDEKELINGLKNNNEKAAVFFLKRHSALVKRIAFQRGVTCDSDQDEILSEVTLEFIKKCKEGLKLTCKLSTYLYSFTKYKTLSHINCSYTNKKVELTDNFSYDPDTSDIDYDTYRFRNVVSRLSPQSKNFMKMLLDGYSHKEIMDKMDYKNTSVVKTKKNRLLKEIKKELNV